MRVISYVEPDDIKYRHDIVGRLEYRARYIVATTNILRLWLRLWTIVTAIVPYLRMGKKWLFFSSYFFLEELVFLLNAFFPMGV